MDAIAQSMRVPLIICAICRDTELILSVGNDLVHGPIVNGIQLTYWMLYEDTAGL